MRKPKHISPSAFMLWAKDEDEYVLRHLVTNRPPRTDQVLAASVGSSFDAWTKSNLHAALFGAGADPKFEFAAIFEEQVEPHNRDEARLMGLHCFDNYVATGAYDELLELMQNAQSEPKFEFLCSGDVDGVPLLGYPDCQFVTASGLHVILDWKVRNYCSKYSASPIKNHRICRDGLDWPKPSRSNGKAHKNYKPMDFHGLEINEGYMELADKEWATQLSIYGWLLGEEPGDENVVVCIDELVSKSRKPDNDTPLLRVANHRARVSRDFQLQLLKNIKTLWGRIQSGHVYGNLPREESDQKFQEIEKKAVGLASDGSDLENWFSQLSRAGYRK